MNVLDQTKEDLLRFAEIARECGKYNERLLNMFKNEMTTTTFDQRELLENKIQRLESEYQELYIKYFKKY